MKLQLRTCLALATIICTSLAAAQENPPPRPPRPDFDRPPGQRPEDLRRPDGDRPPAPAQEGQSQNQRRPFNRPEGERSPGAPQEGGRTRESEARSEAGARFPMPPPAPQQLRPYLGVVTTPATPAVAAQAGLAEGFGLVVEEVLADSPAKTAGVERYDVLTKFDDQKLVDPNQLAALVRAAGKEASVNLTALRKGAEKSFTVKIGEKMLPDRQGGDAGDFMRDLWRRSGEAAGPLRERAEDMGRKAQEMSREFQQRMKEFQEKVEQWRKNPGGKFPETPKFPNLGPTEQPGPLPPDVLREMRPGGAPAVQRTQDGATTTWNTANAHVSIKDDAGEIDVRSDNGHRTVIAKNAKGETIFNGPIDTEEQRRQLPEDVRRKLDKTDVRTRVEHRETPPERNAPRGGSGPGVQ